MEYTFGNQFDKIFDEDGNIKKPNNKTEFIESKETVSSRNINRAVRNLYEYENFKDITNEFSLKTIAGNSTVFIPEYNSNCADYHFYNIKEYNNKCYMIIPELTIITDEGKVIYNKPNFELFERQIAEIIYLDLNEKSNNIETWIEYNDGINGSYYTNKYCAKITKDGNTFDFNATDFITLVNNITKHPEFKFSNKNILPTLLDIIEIPGKTIDEASNFIKGKDLSFNDTAKIDYTGFTQTVRVADTAASVLNGLYITNLDRDKSYYNSIVVYNCSNNSNGISIVNKFDPIDINTADKTQLKAFN